MTDPQPNRTPIGIDASPDRLAKRRSIDAAAARQFVIDAARLLSDLHCHSIVIFDVRELSDVTDYVAIASGTSDRQIKSVADDVEQLAGEVGLGRFGREVDQRTTWLVLDFVDAIIHLFEPDTRAHYDLEMMWGDAPSVEWEK